MLLMMSENIVRNMQSNQRTINYSTHLHLVGHFIKSCFLLREDFVSLIHLKLVIRLQIGYQASNATYNEKLHKIVQIISQL